MTAGEDIQKHEAEDAVAEEENPQQQRSARKPSRQKLRRLDSLDVESAKLRGDYKGVDYSMSVILLLAFESLGIVYGDIGTSPLYALSSTFPNGIGHPDDILGALSLVFYTLTLLPVCKYVFIVLRANDNGDGGTFALYSLICRHAKAGLLPSQEAEDKDVSTFQLDMPNDVRVLRASKLKSRLEKSNAAKVALLFATMLGTSMVIGDGVLTPSMSVLSAVGGIKQATPAMTEDKIVGISVVILILLFEVQRFGTDKVGFMFAPIITLWFILIAAIGVYNFFKHDPSVIKALYPKYIIDYFARRKKDAWISLGGIVLSTTGTEAMFADLGHFSVPSIQISMCFLVYPSIVFAYFGQCAYLRKHSDEVADIFFKSIPGPLYWPMFVIALLAATIASQAMISGTFSIIQQSLSLGCFPRVKIVHTSAKYRGQVYIPEINYLLMIACIGIVLGFKTPVLIGNAYGIAVVFVMALTSVFLVLIMILIWKTNMILVIMYVLVFLTVELVYLSSVLYKFDQGGYLPLVFAFVLMTIMYTWNVVYRKKYCYELQNKISPQEVKEIAASANVTRVPGMAIFYSELVHGIPPIFKHYVENVPALHTVLVFLSYKSLPISKVPPEERFLFRRVQPSELNVFRCVARYGYTDVQAHHDEPLDKLLIDNLKDFIKDDYAFSGTAPKDGDSSDGASSSDKGKSVANEAMQKEIEFLERAWGKGVVHLVGENEVISSKEAGISDKIIVDYVYNFLKKNLRQAEKVFEIPQKQLLKVGMTYEL